MTCAVSADLHRLVPMDAETGGEDGLGGLHAAASAVRSRSRSLLCICRAGRLGVLYVLRVVPLAVRACAGGDRENQMRATFQGYAGSATSSPYSCCRRRTLRSPARCPVSITTTYRGGSGSRGSFLASCSPCGDRGKHGNPCPAVPRLFYICFANCIRSGPATAVLIRLGVRALVCTRRAGIVGIGAKIRQRLRPPPEEEAAMSLRRSKRIRVARIS